jgi:hypothetical protein
MAPNNLKRSPKVIPGLANFLKKQPIDIHGLARQQSSG